MISEGRTTWLLTFFLFIIKHKKSRDTKLSIRSNVSDDENETYAVDDQADLGEQARNANMIRRARTEPFISSQGTTNANSRFPSGLWRRLSWKYSKDTALNELESRPGK